MKVGQSEKIALFFFSYYIRTGGFVKKLEKVYIIL